ncbi:MAG: SpoIIE family protein phosphatase [Anaerolineae bacterium]
MDWIPLAMLGSIVVALAACWAIAHRRARNLLLLAGLSQRLSQIAAEPEAVYKAIQAQVRRVTDAPDLIVQLSMPSPNAEPILLVDGVQVSHPEERDRQGDGPYAWMLQHLRQLVIADTELLAPVSPFPSDPPAGSAVYTPLTAEGHFYGVVTLQSPSKRAFTRGTCFELRLIADQVALGLHTAVQHQSQERTSRQLLMIAEVSRRVAAILDLDTLFADTVRLVRETFGYYHVCLFSADIDSREIVLQSSSSASIQQRGMIIPWGHGLIGRAALGETALANNVRTDSRFLPDTALEATASELSLPLMVEDRVLGVLDLQSAEVNGFDTGDIATLRILADQIAVAIEDSRLYRAQQEQAWIATALLRVAEAVAEQENLADITSTVERLTILLTGVTRCAVLVWQAEIGAFLLPRGTTDQAASGIEGRIVRPLDAPLAERARILASPAEGPAQELGELWPGQAPDASVTCLPLITKGQVIGVLATALDSENALPPAQRTVLEGIARQAALGLDNASLLASRREEAWESTALLQVANVISGTSYDLTETVNTIVRLIPMLIGVSWCAILVWDPDTQLYEATSSYGLPVELQEQPRRRRIPSSIHPWLVEIQRNEGISRVDASMMHDLQFEPSEASESEIQALSLRAHRRDLGLLFVGSSKPVPDVSPRTMAILSGIAGQTALAISATRLYQQSVRHESLEHELRLAREIQESFLPEHCPDYPGWEIAVDWRAARGVGGDYYDFIEFGDGSLGVSIADVSDKGIAAALYMAMSRSVLRAASLDAHSPAETLQRANQVLMQESRSGMFVSLVYATIQMDTGSVRYVRAGHNIPLHMHVDGTISLLAPAGIALGIMQDPELEEDAITLEPGESLVLYTDGITEAWNEAEDEFGMQRLLDVVASGAGASPEELIGRVRDAVETFVGRGAQSDDYTILVVKRAEKACAG